MDELTSLENWAAPLLAKLAPAERRALTRSIARDLRRSQAERIAVQRAPDGFAYVPRKLQKAKLRAHLGQDRVRTKMFAKLKSTGHLRAQADANEIAVGFAGRTARIARVHQEGLPDAVEPGGPKHKYPVRELLGLEHAERHQVAAQLLNYLRTV